MALGRGSYEIMVAAEETDEGEIASALDGGVGVLVVRATEVVEVVG
jgi:hypothetical protein